MLGVPMELGRPLLPGDSGVMALSYQTWKNKFGSDASIVGRKLFADSADVPMCQVARSAGVGQATLYRNFPDRGALAAEILGERIDRIVELAAAHADDPDAFFVLLRSLVDTMAGVYALAELAREDARTDQRLKQNRLIIAELMRGPMRDAKEPNRMSRTFIRYGGIV